MYNHDINLGYMFCYCRFANEINTQTVQHEVESHDMNNIAKDRLVQRRFKQSELYVVPDRLTRDILNATLN